MPILISIITACYNSAETIAETISSVSKQKYKHIEYIVVDGASTDETLDILKHSPTITRIVSEPDNGIYDAMNKGLSLANGDVIGLINSDDFYIDDNVLSYIATVFENPDVDACYADLLYVNEYNTNKISRYWKSQSYKNGLFKSGWMPAHPTFFARKSVYEKHGVFDLKYKIAADFELLFRFIEINKIRTVYLPKVLIKMRLGGTTNKSLRNIWTQNKEIIQILQSSYSNFSIIKFIAGKLFDRAHQFLNKPRDI